MIQNVEKAKGSGGTVNKWAECPSWGKFENFVTSHLVCISFRRNLFTGEMIMCITLQFLRLQWVNKGTGNTKTVSANHYKCVFMVSWRLLIWATSDCRVLIDSVLTKENEQHLSANNTRLQHDSLLWVLDNSKHKYSHKVPLPLWRLFRLFTGVASVRVVRPSTVFINISFFILPFKLLTFVGLLNPLTSNVLKIIYCFFSLEYPFYPLRVRL